MKSKKLIWVLAVLLIGITIFLVIYFATEPSRKNAENKKQIVSDQLLVEQNKKIKQANAASDQRQTQADKGLPVKTPNINNPSGE